MYKEVGKRGRKKSADAQTRLTVWRIGVRRMGVSEGPKGNTQLCDQAGSRLESLVPVFESECSHPCA